MPRKPATLPARLSLRRVRRALRRLGFEVREGGKHMVFFDPEDRRRRVVVPRHGDVKGFTLRQNLRAVGISEETFMAHY